MSRRKPTRPARRDPVIVEIEPLFVLETAQALRGRGVPAVRIPDPGEQLPAEAVEVRRPSR